MENDVKTMYAL